MRYDVCKLIKQTPDAHGAFDTITETETQVYCGVKSVTRSEYYSAFSSGLSPEWVLVISNTGDYNGEREVVFNGKRCRVIRVYNAGDTVELTIGEEGTR